MNSRTDDHELSSSSSRRVSAKSRFSAPPSAAFDYGNNDNFRTTPKQPKVSKSGINGNRAYEDDDDEEGLNSRSARRASQKRLELNDIDRKGVALNRTMSSGSAASSSTKDRPWRTSASSATTSSANDRNSSSMDYVTACDDMEDDLSSTEERSSSGIEVSRNQSTNSESSVEVSTPTRNRWAQYETDDLAEESRQATSNAVVDMATKYADRQVEEDAPMIPTQPMGGSASDSDPWQKYRDDPNELESNGNSLEPPSMPDSANSRSTTDYVKSRFNTLMNARKNNSPENRNSSDYERNLSASSTQSDHDKVRNEALKMLQIADNCLMESPRNSAPNSPRSSINSSGTTGLFRTKGGGLAMRELHNDEISGIRTTTKREKASALAGLDRYSSGKKKGEGASRFDGTFTIGSQDEDDLKAYNSNGTPLSPNDDTPSSSRRWSSRFSVEHQLMAITGGLDSTAMLNKMDILNSSRDKTKSARGLYRASGYAMDGSHEDYNDYNNSSSTGVGLGGIWLWLRGTLWSDDLELNHDGTTQSLVRREKAMQRRRRLRWGLGFLVGLCVLVGVLVEMGNPRGGNAYKAGSTDVNFYVLADEPYDFSNMEQLARELEALPESAEFVIHLGNANSDSQSRCQEYGFERAAAILKESPVPVLVIPGDLDWAACGTKKKAEAALSYWNINLGQKLEKNWDHPFDIEYSDDVIGNFAFLHKGVLFISVSIVDAETEPNEVTLRLEQNVLWTKSQLSDHDSEDYRAVVIFGHAPPSSRQGEYFWPVIEQIKDLDKPVLYLHANADGSFEKYTPFSKAENFQAVQLEQRGREAPMRVVVNSNGDDAFEFERRDPTIRTEKD